MDYSIFSRFSGFQLLVGFSGGADSTALLLLASQAAEKYDLEVTAIHFNHHLRGAESDKEAEDAAAFAGKLKVKFQAIDLNIHPGGNLEARARSARLEKWQELCAGREKTIVLLGHHQDDRIENLFIRIGRGSNVSGLIGMSGFSEVAGVKFFRPLLHFSRSQIEEFLRKNGIVSWAVDSSNLNCDFTRNILRNKILPEFYQLFPGGRKAVASTVENLACDAAFLDELARERYLTAENRFEVDFWADQNRALSVRMLRMLCAGFFGFDSPLPAAAVSRFEDMVKRRKDGICVLDECRKLRFSGGKIFPVKDSPPEIPWNFREQSQITWGNWRFTACKATELPENLPLTAACFDGDKITGTVWIGAAEPGERMLPFGRKKTVKIKELRSKRKIPAYPPVPVVRDSSFEAIWVPGVRHSGVYPVLPGGEIMIFYGENVEEFN